MKSLITTLVAIAPLSSFANCPKYEEAKMVKQMSAIEAKARFEDLKTKKGFDYHQAKIFIQSREELSEALQKVVYIETFRCHADNKSEGENNIEFLTDLAASLRSRMGDLQEMMAKNEETDKDAAKSVNAKLQAQITEAVFEEVEVSQRIAKLKNNSTDGK